MKSSDITKDEAVGILADIARANIVSRNWLRVNEAFTTILDQGRSPQLPLSMRRSTFCRSDQPTGIWIEAL